MPDGESSELGKVQRYREIVLRYEAVDAEIDALLTQHGGASENLSDEERGRYRQLAAQRDDLLNEMRVLEQELLEDDEKPS